VTYRVSVAISRADNVEADLLACATSANYVVGNALPITGAPSITGASLSSNKLVLASGASYVIEYSLQIYVATYNHYARVQWYDETNSAFVGNEAQVSQGDTKWAFRFARITRPTARALILASDFGANSTLTLYPRVTATTSSSAQTHYNNTYAPPTVKILRIS
jgi:hypothetical protein